jgi:PKD repeat protein
MRYGICAGGAHVGPEPGENGKGYYAIMKNNVALLNDYIGLYNWNPHGIIQDNVVIQNAVAGIDVSYHSNNTTLSGNYVASQPIGIQITDQAKDLILVHNLILENENAGLFIKSNNGLGNGAIFDNYFGSYQNLNGTGHIENFVWSNPKGPTPGENIRYGPFIAGNYWSNPDGNGWSDTQAPSVTGYSQVPYEVISGRGVYDTAPLVRIGHNVSSFADEWTIIHPIGNITYPRYSDPYYITQAKPGAILNNLRVDGFLNASAPSYSFSFIDQDHIIETIGSPELDQVHVRFTYSPSMGNYPLKVQFTDNSIGSPNSWYWQFGDGEYSTIQNPEHMYMIPGTYTVSLRAYNDITGGNSICNNCITVQ